MTLRNFLFPGLSTVARTARHQPALEGIVLPAHKALSFVTALQICPCHLFLIRAESHGMRYRDRGGEELPFRTRRLLTHQVRADYGPTQAAIPLLCSGLLQDAPLPQQAVQVIYRRQ